MIKLRLEEAAARLRIACLGALIWGLKLAIAIAGPPPRAAFPAR